MGKTVSTQKWGISGVASRNPMGVGGGRGGYRGGMW